MKYYRTERIFLCGKNVNSSFIFGTGISCKENFKCVHLSFFIVTKLFLKSEFLLCLEFYSKNGWRLIPVIWICNLLLLDPDHLDSDSPGNIKFRMKKWKTHQHRFEFYYWGIYCKKCARTKTQLLLTPLFVQGLSYLTQKYI